MRDEGGKLQDQNDMDSKTEADGCVLELHHLSVGSSQSR